MIGICTKCGSCTGVIQYTSEPYGKPSKVERACAHCAPKLWATRFKMLDEFLDWCVLRNQYPERKAFVTAWCQCNWPEAVDDDVEWLFESVPKTQACIVPSIGASNGP